MGFIVHQQGWHEAVWRWGPVWIRAPRAALATWRARAALPVITIDMSFSNYQRLVSLREQALQLNVHVPVEGEAVAATVILGSGPHQTVEVRLPGGSAARLANETWPLEFRLRDTTVWMRLTPADEARAEFAWQQWGYLEALRREGFVTATQTLVHLRLNGEAQGLFMLETPATDEVLVGFDAQTTWEALASGETLSDDGFRYASVIAGSDRAAIGVPPAAKAAAARLHAAQVGRLPRSEICDAEALGRFLALTALWTGQPAPDWQFLRWRYDPQTLMLTPVGGGQPSIHPSPLPDALLDDPVIQTAYARALATFSSPAYLQELRRDEGEALEQQWLVLNASTSATPWALLETRQRSMRARLAPAQALATALETDSEGFVLHLANLQAFPVVIMGLDAGGSRMHGLDPAWVLPEDRGGIVEDGEGLVLRAARGALPRTVRLRLPRDLATAGGDTVYVVCRLWNAPSPELRVPIAEAVLDPEESP